MPRSNERDRDDTARSPAVGEPPDERPHGAQEESERAAAPESAPRLQPNSASIGLM